MLELVGKVRKSVVVADITKDCKALVIISGKEHLYLPEGTYIYNIPDIDNNFGVIQNTLIDIVGKVFNSGDWIKYIIIYANSNKNMDVFRNFLQDLEEKYPDKTYILAHKGVEEGK